MFVNPKLQHTRSYTLLPISTPSQVHHHHHQYPRLTPQLLQHLTLTTPGPLTLHLHKLDLSHLRNKSDL